MQALHIDVQQQRELRLSGEMDVSTAGLLSDALDPMVTSGGDLVVDLAAVEFMDGSGLRPLLVAAHCLEGRGHVVLESPSTAVSRVLGLVKAERFRNVEIRVGGSDDRANRIPACT